MTDLIEQLARLDDTQRLDVMRRAKALRIRQEREVVRFIREMLLPMESKREVARIVDAVKNGGHGGVLPEMRAAIKREIEDRIGSFDELPGPESLRKWLD